MYRTLSKCQLKECAMAATTMVHVRVEEHIKSQATETLASMGLTVSDAVRVFLTRVVTEQQLPFALKAPNAGTRAAMQEARTKEQRAVCLERCTDSRPRKKRQAINTPSCQGRQTVPGFSSRIGQSYRTPAATT